MGEALVRWVWGLSSGSSKLAETPVPPLIVGPSQMTPWASMRSCRQGPGGRGQRCPGLSSSGPHSPRPALSPALSRAPGAEMWFRYICAFEALPVSGGEGHRHGGFGGTRSLWSWGKERLLWGCWGTLGGQEACGSGRRWGCTEAVFRVHAGEVSEGHLGPPSAEMQAGSQMPCLVPLTFSSCPLWCLSNLPESWEHACGRQACRRGCQSHLASTTCQVERKGTPWGGRRSGRLPGTRCSAAWPTGACPMKACLTLLSHLGRLHEPPVPKPRGTPKLSERYAGSERLSGSWWWEWGAPGVCLGGDKTSCGPMARPTSLGGEGVLCPHPLPQGSCGWRCLVETYTSGVFHLPEPPLPL